MTTFPKCFPSSSAPGKTWRRAGFQVLSLIFLAALLPAVYAQQPPEPASGHALAEQLRATSPDENSTVTGVLHIRAGSSRTNIPIVCKIEAAGASNTWRALYDAGSDHLIVVHATNAANQYFYSTGGGPTNAVAPENADTPLAGSDFSLADLGLDFLQWPIQTLKPGEMRLGQPCYVLDSQREGKDITRVRSYIDKQSGGVILAEAYDRGGVLLKEFSLRGSFFRKVHGQWRLEKIEMSDRRKHSQTIMQFDINH